MQFEIEGSSEQESSMENDEDFEDCLEQQMGGEANTST